jgi:hypothetical protein
LFSFAAESPVTREISSRRDRHEQAGANVRVLLTILGSILEPVVRIFPGALGSRSAGGIPSAAALRIPGGIPGPAALDLSFDLVIEHDLVAAADPDLQVLAGAERQKDRFHARLERAARVVRGLAAIGEVDFLCFPDGRFRLLRRWRRRLLRFLRCDRSGDAEQQYAQQSRASSHVTKRPVDHRPE